ncbi:Cdc6/Cdc18 family protein [Halorubrum lipolyticum]|uniref:Cell division control protein n=1 Tax=Halorubrum lipolyticum DSM 21995 TaxID=1227482 RepID=M0NYP7_9EURY|nr:AAA family ATPase [Halorubrum lipolyticum]EMA63022.1 cell division control protein [Halorubrum lipolyticum DSM 21995]
MNIDDRIERRLGYDVGAGVLVDIDAVSPVSHVEPPIGRGPAIERLLDVLEPAFAGSLPPSAYVHGPKGSGKSAILSALFRRLASHSGPRRAIQTSTRAVEPTLPGFVYVDAREASTRFALYHAGLDAVSDESVPEHGIGTDELVEALRDAVDTGPDLVVAVDHTNEPETPSAATVVEWLTAVSDRVVPVCLGRDEPAAIEWDPEEAVGFEPYRRHVLVELLTSRCSTGLGRDALTHDQIREVSEWADGDAHDALAAVAGAAITAERAGASTVRPEDLDAGIEAVPRPGVALGRVLALSESRRRLLYELVSLSDDDRASVSAATETIASREAVDLSPSTVRRVLYELADAGLLDRVTARRSGGKGRPPSRLVPRFPTLVFRELFDRPSWSV